MSDKQTIPELNSELAGYQQQLEAATHEALTLVHDLTEASFNWRADNSSWSIGECIAHLNATSEHYLPSVVAAITDAKARGIKGAPPFRYGWLGNYIVRSLEPPPRRKFKSPRKFQPANHLTLKTTIDDFQAKQNHWLDLIARANEVDLQRVKISSPISSLLKFSLGQVFALTCAHERRHIWQAQQVKASPSFPGH